MYVFTRNIYIDENNSFEKWAQDVTGYLFKYNGESKLIIDLWFQTLDKYGQKPIKLQIYINRIPAYSFNVTKACEQQIIVLLENINLDTLEVTIMCNSFFVPEGDYRQMAFFLGDMKLVK